MPKISVMVGRGTPVIESQHYTADRAIRALRNLVVTPPTRGYIAGSENALRSAGFSFDPSTGEWFVLARNGQRFAARVLPTTTSAAVSRVKLRCPVCQRITSGRVLDSGLIRVASHPRSLAAHRSRRVRCTCRVGVEQSTLKRRRFLRSEALPKIIRFEAITCRWVGLGWVEEPKAKPTAWVVKLLSLADAPRPSR